MANIFKGSAILWGCGTTTGTISALGALTLLQGEEVSGEAQKETAKDGDGNTKTVVYYDQELRASLEFIPTSTATDSGAHSITAMLTAGVTVALTDASFSPIQATWIVDKPATLTRSNTKALMARVDLVRYVNNSLPA